MAAEQNRTVPDTLWSKSLEEILREREEIEKFLRNRFARRVAVLFSDLVGSTSYYELHGDIAGRALVQRHHDLLRPAIEGIGGRVVKTIGDAIMAAFDEPRAALAAGVRMQHAVARFNQSASEPERLHIRVGIHCGEALVEDTDIFGDVVNVAARVQSIAAADELIVSEAIRAHCVPGDPLEAKGHVTLKGKSEPTAIYNVDWRSETSAWASGGMFSDGLQPPALPKRYVVQDFIGSGGMATVWRARDTRLGREVAIKALHPHLGLSDASRERFRREAAVAAKIQHPNVVQLFDASEPGAAVDHLVMELVDGETLRERLEKKGPLGPIAAAELALQIAQALQAAHARGVVHRDVKPENIFITREGSAKLGDFGIAAVADMARVTGSGVNVGTPAYMAPEQTLGEADTRVDLFALGVVLVEAATGAYPFGARGTPAAFKAMAEGRLNTGGLDDGLAAIAVEAAHPDSAKRFASAAELAAALDAWLEGSRAREVARLQRWARPRRRGLAAAGAAVLVFAGVAAVLSTRGPSTSTAATSPATAPVPVTVTVPATVTEPVSASRTAPVAPAPAPPPAPPAIAIAQPVAPKSTRRKASNEPGPPPPPAPPAVAAAPPVGPRSTPLEGSSDPGPPRAVDTRPGKIVIQVFPWADIWVDGVHRGVKDVTVELPPGTHTISLRHPTLGQRSEEIRVEPGQRVERRFNMQALR